MKRAAVFFLFATFFSFQSWAQPEERLGVKNVISSSASYKKNINHTASVVSSGTTMSVTIDAVSIVSGLPYLGIIQSPYNNSNDYTAYSQRYDNDLGFPWGVAYQYRTFEEQNFTISKGYFSDRVDINWDVTNNLDVITGFKVYRTEDIDSDNPDWGDPVRTLPANAKSYEDRNVEGGKLYRYKIKAFGVINQDPDTKYVTYITGIGFRNPSAVVTGNVSFEGGNPVENVLISAVPDGGFGDFGSALSIPADGYAETQNEFHQSLNASITLQAWVKPQSSFSNDTINIISLTSDRNQKINFKTRVNGTALEVFVNDHKVALDGGIPNGLMDNRSNDLFIPATDFNDNFVHLSTVLVHDSIPKIYINGRLIDDDYVAYANEIIAATATSSTTSSTVGTITLQTSDQSISIDQGGGGAQTWTTARLGGGKDAFIDEVRIWNKVLTSQSIKRDFRRYLKGNEDGFHTYIRANERVGKFAYDLAHTGFNFHSNDFHLKSNLLAVAQQASFVTGSGEKPTNAQLGIFGITDENGNYVLPSVPYEGVGQTFSFTPSLGVHAFDPIRELIYLGEGSTVVNNLDFIDVSAFTFRGRVLYDSRGVFPEGPETDQVRGDIIDGEAYNAYLVDGLNYPKGEYWAAYSDDVTPTITHLARYAPIPLEGANVYVDGNLVLDAENQAVVTDEYGRFTIQVPIGEHRVSVDKFNHEFKFDGKYPAEGMVDYFEDNDQEIVFIDETKVTVVGRVVGGTREANKPLGFGFDGLKTHVASPTDIVYSSVNNIGTASVTLGYRSPGATSITPEFKTTFSTNQETGEYRVDVLPLRYELSQSDLYVPSQRLISEQTFLTENELINFSSITPEEESHFVVESDTIATSLPYNYRKSFIKRVTPIITVMEQTSDQAIRIGEESYTVSNSAFNVYSQESVYSIELQRIERYTNYESEEPDGTVDNVPVTDGELIVTNQLVASGPGNDALTEDEDDPSMIEYKFKAGDPNTDPTSGFLKTISLLYRLNDIDYQIEGYQPNGVILGAIGDGGQTFQTAGPEVPDIILRDPPGSNSFATIEEGSSFSIAKANVGSYANTTETELEIKLGVKFEIGGGITGPAVETENYASLIGGFNFGVSTSNGDEMTKTYSFNTAISTSDDPDWVGAEADLYIGSSSNMFYGLMNNLSVTDGTVTNNNGQSVSIPVSTLEGTKYISLKKVLAFGPGEEVTTFIYSQRELVNDIIPYYEEIVENYACIESNRDESTPPVPCPIDIQGDGFKSELWYRNQIQLWRRAIQLNERTKYLASSDKEGLKAAVVSEINDNFSIGGVDTKAGTRLKNMLDAFFFENISFDSGVGSVEKSIETGNATAWEHTFAVDIAATIGVGLGLNFGGAGLEAKITNQNAFGYEYSQNEEVESNLVFSYTLQDNDDYNKLSIDVINVMDGNGPVFITRGGETSCPVEEAQYSLFYNEEIQPVVDPIISELRTLSPTESIELSAGTIGVEVPYIAVNNASIAGVPEGDAAEFTLTLRNDSVLGPEESEFVLYVNQTTNPDNAIFNLGDNGRVFFLDGSETVEYTLTLEKGSSDVYDYEDIEIVFESLCDDDLSMSVNVSAFFIESCTRVNMLQPNNNWVKNDLNTIEENRNVPLNIVLNEFDLGFDSFERITLEYRQAGSAEWTRLQTYVVSQTIYDQLVENGDTNVTTVTMDQLEIEYAWDIVAQSLPDGNYELRARSFCLNGTTYTSQPITGKVDLTPPTVFGTPQPTNGILSIGSDLIARFNEPVKANGTLTRYEFKVQKNQLPVNHEVSLSFNGSSNVARLVSPFIKSGNFAIEFWLKTQSQGAATLLDQEGGLGVSLSGNRMTFRIGGEEVSGQVASDGTWNHYAMSYNNETGQMVLIENDNEIASRAVNTDLSFSNNNPIIIGGNNFRGNLHDLRFWTKFVARETAVAYQNELLNGNEANLVGYWPMNEGHGTIANDISRFKHLALENVDWEIFPNGNSYAFDGNHYLTLTETSGVIITKDMDATLSFWMKTSQTSRATLLSNGRGDASDLVTNNNYRNRWSIELNENGGIELKAEDQIFPFGTTAVNDDQWHHVALVLRRNGNLSTFIDGQRVATAANSELGGFSGSRIFVGARGQIQLDGSDLVDQYYEGLFDELRIWSLAKSAEQVNEDQFFEADYESLGLMLYAPFNAPEVATGNGPRYYYPVNSLTKASTVADIVGGAGVQYSEVTPPVKPLRPTESLVVNASINQDEVYLLPLISDWASVEKKVANVTIANLYDLSDNRQLSPVTWSVFIDRNPLSWYVEGYGTEINMVKALEEDNEMDISLVNRSGSAQPYYISGPSWLEIPEPNGTVPPNSTLIVRARINQDISPGTYDEEIILSTDYGYDEKLQINLRVIAQELPWEFDPEQYEQSMNLIGKIRVNNEISMDFYDKIIAYVGDDVRGIGALSYVEVYDEYFVLLTVYGNVDEAEEIDFRIWDASEGRLKVANVEGISEVFFTPNELLGDYQTPLIFENTIQETQRIDLNRGWSWVSFNVNGNEFDDLNALFHNLNLQTSDIIVSNSPALFDTYEVDANNPDATGWYGSLSANGGLSAQKMYKIRLSEAQTLYTTGSRVSPSDWEFNISQNWNWLPFILNARVPINEALARLDAQPGDLIKSQSEFAIYDGSNGWVGTLTYLNSGEGYMLRASQAQTFSYPSYFSSKTSTSLPEKQKESRYVLPGYAKNMNAVVALPEGYDQVRFVDAEGTVVGKANGTYVQGKYTAFVTIFGEETTPLKVEIGCDNDFHSTATTINFEADTLLGTLEEPLTLDEIAFIGATFTAYPNPVATFVDIAFESKTTTTAEVVLYSMQMKRVRQEDIAVQEGDNKLRIPMSSLRQGSYIIHLNVEGRVFTKLVIKE